MKKIGILYITLKKLINCIELQVKENIKFRNEYHQKSIYEYIITVDKFKPVSPCIVI